MCLRNVYVVTSFRKHGTPAVPNFNEFLLLLLKHKSAAMQLQKMGNIQMEKKQREILS